MFPKKKQYEVTNGNTKLSLYELDATADRMWDVSREQGHWAFNSLSLPDAVSLLSESLCEANITGILHHGSHSKSKTVIGRESPLPGKFSNLAQQGSLKAKHVITNKFCRSLDSSSLSLAGYVYKCRIHEENLNNSQLPSISMNNLSWPKQLEMWDRPNDSRWFQIYQVSFGSVVK